MLFKYLKNKKIFVTNIKTARPGYRSIYFYFFFMRVISYISVFLTIFSLASLSSIYASEKMCIQMIQHAENISTSECQAFPTPCDVPTGWTPVSACIIKEKIPVPVSPKFEVENFESCEDMEDAMLDIFTRYQSRYWYPYPLYRRGMIDNMVTTASPMSLMEGKDTSK